MKEAQDIAILVLEYAASFALASIGINLFLGSYLDMIKENRLHGETQYWKHYDAINEAASKIKEINLEVKKDVIT